MSKIDEDLGAHLARVVLKGDEVIARRLAEFIQRRRRAKGGVHRKTPAVG